MVRLRLFAIQDADSKLLFLLTCGMKPIQLNPTSNTLDILTPSRTNTVEVRQSADYLVSAFAKCVMKIMRTLLSVLQVVSASQTSPSDDKAVIMLIF